MCHWLSSLTGPTCSSRVSLAAEKLVQKTIEGFEPVVRRTRTLISRPQRSLLVSFQALRIEHQLPNLLARRQVLQFPNENY
jgi:hypothetical protein